MSKNYSSEIKINVKNKKDFDKNKLVKIAYILMFGAYIIQAVFFGFSAHQDHFSTWYGGIVACIFTCGYILSAYLIIRRNTDNTFISILFLSLIYAFTPLWMGIGYFIDYFYSPLMNKQPYYLISFKDYLLILICLSSMVLSLIGIFYFYRNNTKRASMFTLIACSLSIISCLFCSVTEFYRLFASDYNLYIPLVGISFLVDSLIGVLPLLYLIKTL